MLCHENSPVNFAIKSFLLYVADTTSICLVSKFQIVHSDLNNSIDLQSEKYIFEKVLREKSVKST